MINSHCKAIEHILIVEDSLKLANHLKEQIDTYFSFACDLAENKKDAQEKVRHKQYDLIIADIDLPECDGELIHKLVENGQRVVMMTSETNEKKREELLALPITDYVIKNDAKTLVNYLIQTIRRLRDNRYTIIGICDDSKAARKQMVLMVEPQNLPYLEFEDGQQVIDYLCKQNSKIDILLTDYQMPNIDGLELVRRIRHTFLSEELPIISLSASDKPHILAQFLKAGANDYIHKNCENEEFLTRLNLTLDYLYANRRNKLLVKELEKAAIHDFLTQLYNRSYFFSQIPHIASNAFRQGKPYGILMIDIDFFKKVNDTYGHYAGDRAISHLAMVLNDVARSSDYCFRWGGEEFVVLLPMADGDELAQLGERIRSTVEKSKVHIEEENLVFQITVSIGGAFGLEEDAAVVISKADDMLYEAKNSGRNRVKIFH